MFCCLQCLSLSRAHLPLRHPITAMLEPANRDVSLLVSLVRASGETLIRFVNRYIPGYVFFGDGVQGKVDEQVERTVPPGHGVLAGRER